MMMSVYFYSEAYYVNKHDMSVGVCCIQSGQSKCFPIITCCCCKQLFLVLVLGDRIIYRRRRRRWWWFTPLLLLLLMLFLLLLSFVALAVVVPNGSIPKTQHVNAKITVRMDCNFVQGPWSIIQLQLFEFRQPVLYFAHDDLTDKCLPTIMDTICVTIAIDLPHDSLRPTGGSFLPNQWAQY